MVLILLGMVVMSVLTASNLSAHMKENLTVTVMLSDRVSPNSARLLCKELYHRPYAKNIDYISKDQALQEQKEALGADPSEFIGANPFVATLELRMKSDYANRDSLKWIAAELKGNVKVTDVAYQEDLTDKVNRNLQRLNVCLLGLAVLLSFVSFSLISNTVRLSVYSRRFIIHTMKLVGASWSFIRRPFLRQALGVGIFAAFFACAVLAGGVYWLTLIQTNISSVITWQVLAITGASVFVFGIVITSFCSYLAVNRFLKMTAGELYSI